MNVKMRNLLPLMVCVTLATGSVAAADFELAQGGPGVERGIYVDPLEDGGYIAVGSTQSFGAGAEDIYLVRTDSVGAVVWSRTFGGADPDFGWCVRQVSDGFVLAGFTESFGKGENDFYLVKTSSEGEEEWSQTFGGEGNDRCWALVPTDDGGYLLAGETTSFGEGEEDVYLVRTDARGTPLWSRTYGGAGSDRCFSVVQAADGGYVLAGQTFSEGAGDRDAYVLKTSASGELEWTRTYGGEASDVGHGVAKTSDGGFIVTGYTTSFAATADDPYLIKIDAQGETLWTRVLNLDWNGHTITGEQAVDGGYYLVGFSEYRGLGPTAALLIKTDGEGNMAWHRDIHASEVGETFGYTVRATDDGGCVFAGHTTTGTRGNLDLLIVGVDGDDQP